MPKAKLWNEVKINTPLGGASVYVLFFSMGPRFDPVKGFKGKMKERQKKANTRMRSPECPAKCLPRWKWSEKKFESRVARFFLMQYTKTMENIPNYHITKWP
jgi:hypothetical protein